MKKKKEMLTIKFITETILYILKIRLFIFFDFISEFGKQPGISNVQGGLVTVRRGDGALVSNAFYTLFISLHQHVTNRRWQEALSLCRIAQVCEDQILRIYKSISVFLESRYPMIIIIVIIFCKFYYLFIYLFRMKHCGLVWQSWLRMLRN